LKIIIVHGKVGLESSNDRKIITMLIFSLIFGEK